MVFNLSCSIKLFVVRMQQIGHPEKLEAFTELHVFGVRMMEGIRLLARRQSAGLSRIHIMARVKIFALRMGLTALLFLAALVLLGVRTSLPRYPIDLDLIFENQV